mgnify:CR=1 FL=1
MDNPSKQYKLIGGNLALLQVMEVDFLKLFMHKEFDSPKQCCPYQVVTGKIYRLKQQQATVLTACNLLKVS